MASRLGMPQRLGWPGEPRKALGKARPERGSVCDSPVLQTQDLSEEGAEECKTVSQQVIHAATFWDTTWPPVGLPHVWGDVGVCVCVAVCLYLYPHAQQTPPARMSQDFSHVLFKLCHWAILSVTHCLLVLSQEKCLPREVKLGMPHGVAGAMRSAY